MNKQPEMVTALYYRAARKNDDTNLYLATKIGSEVVYFDKQVFNAS